MPWRMNGREHINAGRDRMTREREGEREGGPCSYCNWERESNGPVIPQKTLVSSEIVCV